MHLLSMIRGWFRAHTPMTAQQHFFRSTAHRARELFCSVCGQHPPKHAGGPCDLCNDELGVGG